MKNLAQTGLLSTVGLLYLKWQRIRANCLVALRDRNLTLFVGRLGQILILDSYATIAQPKFCVASGHEFNAACNIYCLLRSLALKPPVAAGPRNSQRVKSRPRLSLRPALACDVI